VAEGKLVLVSGATGYVGGRLVPRLLAAGYRVRCLVRDRTRLQGRPWLRHVEVVQGDILRPATLQGLMRSVDVAYYLIHSMSGGPGFEARDLAAAREFAQAARAAGVQRIIYLGGLGDPGARLSTHLRSRQKTGDALREAGVPVTEFRAAVIVGSGSLSFEMVRYLAERLPIMICPKWVYTRVQPIAIRNVLEYLVAALETPESAGQIIGIGGADVLTYGDMLLGYAKIRGLRRFLVPVPVLSPRLSVYWLHLVTPIPVRIAAPLVEGLRNEVVVRDDKARRLFPQIQPMDYSVAVRRALVRLETGQVDTAWSDALVSSRGDLPPVTLTMNEGILIERRQRMVQAPCDCVYRSFAGIGGHRGWFYLDWAWQVRGTLDWLVGGVGMRRGRRDPDDLRVGDALDFWRVEAVEPGRLVRLRAEMKMPGEAWLEFRVRPMTEGRTHLTQAAFFVPKGVWGLNYWYALYVMHAVIFSGLIRTIARRAEKMAAVEPQAVEAPTFPRLAEPPAGSRAWAGRLTM
jgi:uncharacterized protein YbjT (DUF2867 family)